MTSLLIPVYPEHIRTIPDPNVPDIKTMYALVNVLDVPFDSLSLAPDPRVPKHSQVTREIVNSLVRWDGTFHLKNRGITISAQAAEYDNNARRLRLIIPEEDQYGVLDGGHTMFSIQAVLSGSLPAQDELVDQYVRLEILIGAEDLLGEIARARNTSKQVAVFSLQNQAGDFSWLKKAVQPYDKKVRWSENDPEDFSVLELIQVLTAVNALQFGPSDHPVEAYKNSGKCLQYLTAPADRYGFRALAPVAMDAWRLYDVIRFEWWSMYNAIDPLTGKRGRAGKTAEVKDRKRGKAKLMHYVTLDKSGDPEKGDKHVEKGLAFPVLAGFRALLEVGAASSLQWKTDPFAFFAKHGQVLVRLVMEASDARGNNTQVVGRDPTVYDLVYRSVEAELAKAVNSERLSELEAENRRLRELLEPRGKSPR